MSGAMLDTGGTKKIRTVLVLRSSTVYETCIIQPLQKSKISIGGPRVGMPKGLSRLKSQGKCLSGSKV